MKANDYQKWTKSTVVYKGNSHMEYFTLGLVGEAGEVADKTKKLMRDNPERFPDDKVMEIYYELSDVLWYLARLSAYWGISLEDLMKLNKAKLTKRKKEGKLHGSGDKR